MAELSNIEVNEICKHLGESNPKSIKKVYGGSIHNSWKMEFYNSNLFIKKNAKKTKFLQFEKYCLNDIQNYINHDTLTIPEVIKYLELKPISTLSSL